MLYLNKMLTREQAEERYGAIDLASRVWPDMPLWMTLFEVPKGVFPAFTIMSTGIPVTHMSVNRDIVRPLTDVFDRIINQGLMAEMHTYDGCFNIRPVRGQSYLMSAHSYGLAVDFNAATNPLGGASTMSPQLVSCFTAAGFDWGGNFTRRDGMHFSYAWEG